jgi:hypothetical protein
MLTALPLRAGPGSHEQPPMVAPVYLLPIGTSRILSSRSWRVLLWQSTHRTSSDISLRNLAQDVAARRGCVSFREQSGDWVVAPLPVTVGACRSGEGEVLSGCVN